MSQIIQLGIFEDPSWERKFRRAPSRRRVALPRVGPTREAPLLDGLEREVRRGRKPSADRPIGCPPTTWENLLRARGRRKNPELTLEEFLPSHLVWLDRVRLSRGFFGEQPTLSAKVRWTIEIQRKDLTPEMESDWRRRLKQNPSLAKTYRISLLGIMRREKGDA